MREKRPLSSFQMMISSARDTIWSAEPGHMAIEIHRQYTTKYLILGAKTGKKAYHQVCLTQVHYNGPQQEQDKSLTATSSSTDTTNRSYLNHLWGGYSRPDRVNSFSANPVKCQGNPYINCCLSSCQAAFESGVPAGCARNHLVV